MASGDYQQKQTKCHPKNPSSVLRKLVELMLHPMAEKATERHLQMLNAFINSSHYAFWLPDIPYVIRLYEALIRKIDTVPDFKRPLECLLNFSAVPPMLTKPSDRMEYARDLQEYFSVLGYLILCLNDESLSRMVLNAIISLLERPVPVGYCCAPIDSIHEAAEKSRLPEILGQLVQVISDNLYPLLLEATVLFCQISKEACGKIAKEHAVEFLLQRLEPTWRDRNGQIKPKNPSTTSVIPDIENICFILWKLLYVVDEGECPSKFALWSLQYALRWSTISPGRQLDRNNLAGIILKLLNKFPTMEFVESELADDIGTLAASRGGCQCSLSLNDDMDFYLKKILWACLHYFKQFHADHIISKNHIINFFAKFLFNEDAQTRGCMEQHCELSKIVLRLIPKFPRDAIEEFRYLNGPSKLVRKIKEFMDKPYDVEMLEAYLYCLHQIMRLEVDEIIKTLGEDAFSTIISVCSKLLEAPTLTQIHQKCLTRAFCILQILTLAGHFDGNVALDLCFNYLNRVIHPHENDPVLDVKTTVCAVHLLWENILSIENCLSQFLQKGGVYAMLDITESCTFPIKSLSLGILADVAKKSTCIPYLITWRKHGRKLIPMLMEIFRGHTEKHCEASDRIELVPEKSENTWIALCHGQKTVFHNCCLTKVEIVQSCRSKIHGILYALRVKFKEKVAIANAHYRLYTEKLSTDDELTMLFAEHFLSLSMCKSWKIIAKELQSEGVMPIDSDDVYLRDKVEGIRQWTNYLKYKIEYIVRAETRNEQRQECDTYIALNEARLSDALDALTELRYVSNCTERMFQMTKKLRLSQDVDSIKLKNYNYHRTMTNLPFMNIYDQTVNIQSNVIYGMQKEESDLALVSSDEEISIQNDDPREVLSEQFLEC